MSLLEIRPRVFSVGVADPERRVFDALVPIPRGTSYNAYVVYGSSATALIDTVEPEFSDEWLETVQAAGVSDVDYIVSNHAEQDHSGALARALQRFPDARVLCTPKARSLLLDLLPIEPSRIQTVADGERISLGDRTLEFLHTPWVHWPETMLTHLPEERLLFSCDLFGAHMAPPRPFASECDGVMPEAARYFATIMAPFIAQIRRYLDRLAPTPLDLVAPSHGPLWDQPATILDAYRGWTGGRRDHRVVIAWVSMHDSTRLLCDALADALRTRGVAVDLFDLGRADLGALAVALLQAPTLILGSPTVLGGAHPTAIHAAAVVNALRPGLANVGIVGSYGWGGRSVEQLTGLLTGLKIELLEPLMLRGVPRPEDGVRIKALADAILARHEALGLRAP